jgi:predicted AlkP superfamily phosphohydrolase/phosphomutase
MDNGAWGSLTSTMPAWTPAAWASIVTGKNPGKHGVYDMAWRRPNSYEFLPTNANVRQGTPFWKRLNAVGLRVGLVNVPFTFPVEPLDGFVVAGFGTPASASDVAYPPEVLPWIQQRFGDYEPTVSSEFLQTAAPAEILEKEVAHQSRQVQIAVELAEMYQVDVLVINLMLPDHANHKMPTMALVQEAYIRSDENLGTLLDAFDPNNVMLISDHGSSRLKGDFLLYGWLQDNGYYVRAKNDKAQKEAALNWLLMQWHLKRYNWDGLSEKTIRYLWRKTLFSLPEKAQSGFWERLYTTFPFAREFVLYGNEPDYKRTKVFPGTAYAGLLYLNLAGRDPEGLIAPEDRREVARELANRLLEVKDPDSHDALFANVYTGDELYHGPAAAQSPDLILDGYSSGWNIRTSPYSVMPSSVRQRYFVDATNEGRDFGWHSREGIYVFSGPEFLAGSDGDVADLLDIPATLLHLCGAPIPDDYDGQVLAAVFKSPVSQASVSYQSGDEADLAVVEDAFTVAEADEVNRHLRALGYLD